jgi:Lon protease-like protein
LQSSWREPNGLYVGSVEWLEVPAPQPLATEHEPLAALLRRLLEPLPLYRDVAASLDDAAWVGGRLVELLPLDLAFKQALLEIRDPAQRLARLAAALRPRENE